LSLSRRILRSNAAQSLLAGLIAAYIRLVHATSRWRTFGLQHPERFWRGAKPFIGCFWHGRLIMMPKSWATRRRIHVLISRHRDGELIARTMRHFDLDTVRGSAAAKGEDKGALPALRAMLGCLQAGEYVCITPDGPKGPRMRAALGIAVLAKLSGMPIVPTTFAASPRIVLSSWDRMILPLPFARGVFVWGEPIYVAPDADEAALEKARGQVEEALNALTRDADRLLGQEPITPEGRR
jgi:lysophospholipid acyltransferase (LPLAT)-like uncharacterized protein